MCYATWHELFEQCPHLQICSSFGRSFVSGSIYFLFYFKRRLIVYIIFGKILHNLFWLHCKKKEPDTESDKQWIGFFAIRDNFTVLIVLPQDGFVMQLERISLFWSFCLRTVLENLFKSSYIDIKLMLTEMPEWCGLKRKSYT